MSSSKWNKPELMKRIGLQFRRFSTRNILLQQTIAHSLGLIHTDLKTADILSETGPITAGELAKATRLSTGSVTALIDRLEREGFVRREKDPDDRRRVIIVPVVERQKQIALHYASLTKETENYSERYNEKELALILQFMTDITNIVEKENEVLLEDMDGDKN